MLLDIIYNLGLGKLAEGLSFGGGKGGGGDAGGPGPASIPQPPSLAQVTRDYISVLPDLLKSERQFDPQFAQLNFDLASQFVPQYTDLYAGEQKRLFPYTFGLQELLGKQATEGTTAQLPPLLRDQYLDQLRQEVGPNIGSPVGSEYISRNLSVLGESYRQYYQNLGLSLLNRFPVNQPVTPNFRQPTANFNLGEAFNYTGQTYGPYVGAYTSALNTQSALRASQLANQSSKRSQFGQIAGGILGAFGGAFTGTPQGVYGGAQLGSQIGGSLF